MKLWQTRPMPDRERVWLTRITATVWAGVLAWNVSHVFEHLGQHRIDGWRQLALSFAPDILILIGVWKLRYFPKSAVAWLMTLVGLAWLSWAALSTCEPTVSGRVIAVAPIGTVVLMTLALEFEQSRREESQPLRAAPAPVARPKPARRPSRPAPEIPAAQSTILPQDAPLTAPIPLGGAPTPVDAFPAVQAAQEPRSEPDTTPLPARRPAPSRETAAEILAGLKALDEVSNAELARRHGGSDRYWTDRKREEASRRLDRELAQIGADAPVE